MTKTRSLCTGHHLSTSVRHWESRDSLIDDRPEPVSDGDQRRTSRQRLFEGRRDSGICLVIDAAGGFIHHDDLGAFQQCSRQHQQLTFSQTEIRTPDGSKCASVQDGNSECMTDSTATKLSRSWKPSFSPVSSFPCMRCTRLSALYSS
jgi:hypothetical protein